MRSLTLVAVVLLLAAFLAASGSAQVRISEVLADPTGDNTGNQKVELINTGTASVDVGGWWICGFFAYRQFPSSVVLAPGAAYVIHLDQSGTNDAGNFYTGNFPTLSAADDAFGLYTTNAFADPSAIADFVQWGATGQPRESTAVDGGVWVSGEFVATPAEGHSIQLCGTAVGASDWIEGNPTLGAANNCDPGVPVETVTWGRLKTAP